MNFNFQAGISAVDLCSKYKGEIKSEGKHAKSSYESPVVSASDEFGYNFLQFNNNFKSLASTQEEASRLGENPQENETGLSLSQQSKVKSILDSVKDLTQVEKLYLYLQLSFNCDESTCNLLNNKENQTQAFQWIRNNLEETDSTVNIPKHQVYEKYKEYSEQNGITHYLAAPDFGKIVKCIFPNVKARRLGTRGNSKYCYNGLTMKESKISNSSYNAYNGSSLDQTIAAACIVICEWANKLLGHVFSTIVELAKYLITGSYVSTKSLSAFIVMSASNEQVANISKRFNMNSMINLKPKISDGVDLKSHDTLQVVPHTQKKSENDKFVTSTQLNIPIETFTIDVSSPVMYDDVSKMFTATQERPVLNDVNIDATSLKHQTCLYSLEKNDAYFTSLNIKSFVPCTSKTTPKKLGRQRSIKNKSPYASFHSNVSPALQQSIVTTQKPILSTGEIFHYVSPSTSYSDMSPSEIEFLNFPCGEFSTRNQYNRAQRCQSVPSISKRNVNVHQPLTPQYLYSEDIFGKPAQMKARRNLSSLFNESSIYNDDVSQFTPSIKERDDVNNCFLKQIEKTNEIALSELEYQINKQPANVLNVDLNLSTPDDLSDLAYSFEDIGGQELFDSFQPRERIFQS